VFHAFDNYRCSPGTALLFFGIMSLYWSGYYYKNGYYYYTHSQEYTKILSSNQILNLEKMRITFRIFVDMGILSVIIFLIDLIVNSLALYVVNLLLLNLACVTIQQTRIYYNNFCESDKSVDVVINNINII
jgi:hypothetical protein